MMHIGRCLFIAVLLVIISGVIVAQNDPLSQSGRFRAGWRSVTVTRANNTTFTARLYYPAASAGQNTSFDPSGAPYAAITFGHGFFQAVSTYQSTLEHLSTHGYLVIATDSEGGLAPNHQNFADDIKRCLTYLEQENLNTSSVLFGQVATSKFGASGHSMGGGASILAASQDTRIKGLANLAAAETNPSAIAAMPLIGIPVSLISGSSDTVVPVASNGQTMFNAANTPKIIPVIQGGWHCGFQDANGFGCDTGTITRGQQLSETRRLLTSFFNLYVKRSDVDWKQVWGTLLENPLVVAQRNPGFELLPVSQTIDAPVGANTVITISVTNRGLAPERYNVFIEQRRWIVVINPQQTVLLNPNQSATITFRVRRLWKNPNLLNRIGVSLQKDSDGLTRSTAVIDLR